MTSSSSSDSARELVLGTDCSGALPRAPACPLLAGLSGAAPGGLAGCAAAPGVLPLLQAGCCLASRDNRLARCWVRAAEAAGMEGRACVGGGGGRGRQHAAA
jgi:hypothetical protein